MDPAFIGRIVDVSADLQTVRITHDGVLIASHNRVWARHLVITDPAHVVRASVMRQDFRTQRARQHQEQEQETVQVRDLAAYDEIFGIDLAHDAAPLAGVVS